MSELHVVLGSGALGSAVTDQLLAAGHQVRVVSRSGRLPLGGARDGLTARAADLTDEAAAVAACDAATVIYFCAGPPYTDWPSLFPPMYRAVMAAASAAEARLVCCENVYPYGRVDGPMTEQTPIAPCSKKGEVRAELGEEVMAAHRDGRLRAALVRGPDYYGPGAGLTTIYGDEVFGRAVAGKAARVFGDLDARHTWACARDFAAGMVAVGGDEEAMGETWHCPCPEPLTQRQMLELIFAEVGSPMKAQAMPGFMLAILSWFMPIMRELREMNYQWQSDYDFRCDKICDRYGLTPTPHPEAIRETVAWFRSR